MVLGKVSMVIGGAGLIVVLAVALISGSMKKRRLQKAMAESDLPR